MSIDETLRSARGADVGYNPNEIDEERSDRKILAGTSASTKQLTQAARGAETRALRMGES